MNIETRMDSRLRGINGKGIKFKLDPAMVEQLQKPTDIQMFLGIL